MVSVELEKNVGDNLENSSAVCNCPACRVAGFGYRRKRLAVRADFSQGWYWTIVSTAYGLLPNERFPVSRAVLSVEPHS